MLKSTSPTGQHPTPPEVGFAAPWMFTAGKGAPSPLQENQRETASADEIAIVVSFITVSGVRKLRDVLRVDTPVTICRPFRRRSLPPRRYS